MTSVRRRKMKRKNVVIAICISLALGGALIYSHLGNLDPSMDFPEGYSNPEKGTAQTAQGIAQNKNVRVEALDIAENIPYYYKESLELVALSPGSGWLKLKTNDGISPTLSFNKINYQDIMRFNKFSKQVGMPIRVALSENVLQIFTEGTTPESDLLAARDNSGSFIKKDFFVPKAPNEKMVLRKNRDGKIFLVKSKGSQFSEEQGIAMVDQTNQPVD